MVLLGFSHFIKTTNTMPEIYQYQLFFNTDSENNLSGSDLRDIGIKRAVQKVDKLIPKWTDKAYLYLKSYVQQKSSPFKCEDFRDFCQFNGLEMPDNLRVFGAIIRRGLKEGLIKSKGLTQVDNPKAHMANACLLCRK